jgi:site-specific DNA-cytosine methylase
VEFSRWLSAKGIQKTNERFGTFICGGGSTMGYKLAGFNHLGGVEIDVKVADVYKENHKPKTYWWTILERLTSVPIYQRNFELIF